MFTGLIEEMGTIITKERAGGDRLLRIRCRFDLERVALGDSIAINGVCLTVVEKGADFFSVQVSKETVARSTLDELMPGSGVNLERALALGGRLDGHLVQGHVDAIGRVERMAPRGKSLEIWFRVPADVGRYIIAKGSIAINGVSLTVNEVADSGGATRFSVNIIPHTRQKTTLADLAPGRTVNIETDLLGRYVERLLKRGVKPGGTVDAAYLRERGF